MATVVKIGGDTTELNRELGKAQTAVGKATAGIGRGMATAFGSSLGPFGELIEKADAFRSSMAGASLATRVMAGAVGVAFVATAYTVHKAAESWERMTEAMDEAIESRRRLEQGGKMSTDSVLQGVSAGHTERAIRVSLDRMAELQKQIDAGQQGVVMGGGVGRVGDLPPEQLKPILDEMRTITQNIADIQTGEARRRGEQRIYGQELSPESRRQMDAEALRLRAAGMGPEDLKELKRQREQLAAIRQNQPQTQAGAITANVSTESIGAIDALIGAIESRLNEGKTTGSMRLHDLTAVGGAGAPSSYVSGAMDSAKKMVQEQETTNDLLDQLLNRGGVTLQP